MSYAVGCDREASLEWLSCRCELIWIWWSKCPHSATEKWEGENKWWCSGRPYSSTCCCIWTHRGGSRCYPKRCKLSCTLQITLLEGTWGYLIQYFAVCWKWKAVEPCHARNTQRRDANYVIPCIISSTGSVVHCIAHELKNSSKIK